LTTVILSRDLDALLRFCLLRLATAVHRAPIASHRIVVVDNASRVPLPPTLPDCPAYDLIRFDSHHGFAQACNLGVRHAPAELALFLNNDVLLADDALAVMTAAFDRYPRLGVCGARLAFPDGTVQHAGVVLAPPPKGPYHVARREPSHKAPTASERFQAVTGACMLVRGDVFARLGGFDEGFDFGYEDVDLCLRAGQEGYEVRCVQAPESLHFESITPGRPAFAVAALERFFAKWEGRYAIDG
jgi:GT2 family glycosyltransferase